MQNLDSERKKEGLNSSSSVPGMKRSISDYSKSELVGLMLKQNMESNRPAWDVRPPVLPGIERRDDRR